MYLHISTYSFHKGIGFSVYGENVIIMMQNFVIILLFWSFDKSIKSVEKFLCIVGLGTYIGLLLQDKHISEPVWDIIVSSNLFFGKHSKFLYTLPNFLISKYSLCFKIATNIQKLYKQVNWIACIFDILFVVCRKCRQVGYSAL